MKLNITAAAVALTSLMGVSEIHSAVITWNTPVTINLLQPTQVSTTGTVLRAYNLAGGSGVTLVVNGVTFTSFQDQATDSTTFTQGAQFAVTDFVLTGNSYAQLINGALFGDGGENKSITFNSLTINQQYQVQFFVYDDRGPAQNRAENFGVGTPAVEFGGGSPSLGGQFSIGTFTADSSSQAVNLFFTNDVVTQANAITLSAIPEPSALALAITGGLGMLVAFRRRSRATAS